MKDHVEIGHLTESAFRVSRDQAMNLEIWFKIHTNVSNLNRALALIRRAVKRAGPSKKV